MAEKFYPLIDSPHLSEEDKKYLRNCISREHMFNSRNLKDVQSFLADISMILGKHFSQPIMLLID